MLRNIVPGRRRPVRPLDQEAEKGLLLGGKEHHQRRFPARYQPRAVDFLTHREGNLDPLAGLVSGHQITVPDEPFLRGAVAGPPERDASPRRGPGTGPAARLGGDGALQHRGGDLVPADSHPLDAPQEQQRPEPEPGQRGGDLRGGSGRGKIAPVEGKDEQGLARGASRRDGNRADVALDPEMLARAVHAGRLRVRVDRLESDAEPADRRQVPGLRGIADPADAPDVGVGEGPAIVPHLKAIVEELKREFPRAGILGILDQLEDEVRPVAVQLPEKIEHGRVRAVPGDVLRTDLFVVSGHQRPPRAAYGTLSPPGPAGRVSRKSQR